MSRLTNQKVIAKYKDAIDKLEAYQSKEPDSKKRKEASKIISELRDKIINQAWKNIIDRTSALEELKDELVNVIDNAAGTPSISKTIDDLSLIVTEVTNLINEQ